MDRSNTIFHYHFLTARDALKKHLDHKEPTNFKNVEIVFGLSDKADVNYAFTVSEANLIACMQTLRASIEVFAQLTNGLLLQSKVPIEKCSIWTVTRNLPQGDLKDALQAVAAMDWFQYLAAFINTTKHRQLIEHSVTVSFEENRAGVRIGSFTYDGKVFPRYWAHDVLRGLADVKNALVLSGKELNKACGA